jgi:outer membrane biosynthesis protein TonB
VFNRFRFLCLAALLGTALAAGPLLAQSAMITQEVTILKVADGKVFVRGPDGKTAAYPPVNYTAAIINNGKRCNLVDLKSGEPAMLTIFRNGNSAAFTKIDAGKAAVAAAKDPKKKDGPKNDPSKKSANPPVAAGDPKKKDAPRKDPPKKDAPKKDAPKKKDPPKKAPPPKKDPPKKDKEPPKK